MNPSNKFITAKEERQPLALERERESKNKKEWLACISGHPKERKKKKREKESF